MCEAGEREQKACDNLIELIKKNGKCSSHEKLLTAVYTNVGMVTILCALTGWLIFTAYGVGRSLEAHASLPAHPLQLERWKVDHDKVDSLERDFDAYLYSERLKEELGE